MSAESSETSPSTGEPRLKIFVSSVVYGHEELLESIYALLQGFGYEVFMSHKGTVTIDPKLSAMENCLRCVETCDLFLGLILPNYGSGKETPEAKSITHREALKAIELNKPRWFLVHEYVAIARQLLMPYRDTEQEGFKLKAGMTFQKTPILSDLRVLEIYEAAMRIDIPEVADRTGNWVQTFGPDDDARLFAMAQFRRYPELAKEYLPRLKDIEMMRTRLKGNNREI